MTALETRPVKNHPEPGRIEPWQPETHVGFDTLNVMDLPAAEHRPAGSKWTQTGFMIAGDSRFVRETLKDRFFHNLAVGYALNENGMIVEFQHQTSLSAAH